MSDSQKRDEQLESRCLEGDHLSLSAQVPHGKVERQKFRMAFNPPSSPSMDRCYRSALMSNVRRHVELLFIRAPFHITVGDPALVVIMA